MNIPGRSSSEDGYLIIKLIRYFWGTAMQILGLRAVAFAGLGILLSGCAAQSDNSAAPDSNAGAPVQSNGAEPVNAAPPGENEASGQAEPGGTAAQPPVKVGERFEVELPQSAGTGYSWDIKSPRSDIVEFVDKSVEKVSRPAGSEPMTGGAEIAAFRFRATAPGTAELVFVNRRPWMDPQPDDRTETRKITVIP
ncbi:MAG TPA: protease inhibitor I42 family protein [Allosphingosinicella sp.]